MAKNKVVYGGQVLMDLTDTTAEPEDVSEGEVFYDRAGNRQQGTGRWMELVEDPTANEVLITDANGQAIGSGVLIGNVVQLTDIATETTLGLIKLNPGQNITLNENNQLEVGGRIGQFEGTTGLFAPNDRQPRQVLDYSFLVTDALGMKIGNRAFADVSGYSITVRSAAPGTTVYYAENTYNNRIIAKTCENGFISKDEATSKVEMTIPVVSVLINGQTFTPDSSPDDPNNPIEITLESSANPDTTVTQLRMFGQMASYATAHIGNGVHTEGGGRNLLVGGGLSKYGSSNDNCMVGMQMYSSGNGNGLFGRNHIAIKNRGFLAGTGHDTTNARGEGASAVGEYSLMDILTLFAVGNGTNATNRSNAFEVTTNGVKGSVKSLDVPFVEQLAPRLIQDDWGTNANWSFADNVLTINGVSAALSCTAKAGKVFPVIEGETLSVSFEAKKAVDGANGNLILNLRTATSTGSSSADNVVITKTSSEITTEWATYSATFTVPSGIGFLLPRITKAKATPASGQNYQIRNLNITRPNDGLCMVSPNGTKWKLQVGNDGTVSTTPIT